MIFAELSSGASVQHTADTATVKCRYSYIPSLVLKPVGYSDQTM